jgi:hypothetical protein
MSDRRRVDCTECGEVKVHYARGLCGPCYHRRRRQGMPPLERKPTFDELLAQASRGKSADECWLWPGTISASGYPACAAYRHVWVRFNGPIPTRAGRRLNVDHRCHSESDCRSGSDCLHRRCVNPAHLRLLSWEDNVAVANRRPMCARSLHPHVPRSERRQSGCPDCYREYKAAYRDARRAELAAAQRARNAARRRATAEAS